MDYGGYNSVMATRGGQTPGVQAAYATYVANQKKKRRRRGSSDSTLNYLLSLFPDVSSQPTLTDAAIRAKASQDVQGILGPLIARQQADYLARVRAGEAAIRDYTGSYAGQVAGLEAPIRGAYDDAKALASQIGTATAKVQGAVNQQGIDAFAAALAGINAPHAGEAVATQGAMNAGGQRVTTQSQDITAADLGNQGQAEGGYYAAQPRIAGLTGSKTLDQYLFDQSQALSSALEDINSQAPGLTQSILQDYYARQQGGVDRASQVGLAKAQLAADWLNSQADRNQNAQIFNIQAQQKQQALDQEYAIRMAQAKTAADRAAIDRWYKQQSVAIAKENADAHATSAAASASQAATAAKTAAKGKPKATDTWQGKVAAATKQASKLVTKDPYTGTSLRMGYQRAHDLLTTWVIGTFPGLSMVDVQRLVNTALAGAGFKAGGGKSTGGGGTTTAPPQRPG